MFFIFGEHNSVSLRQKTYLGSLIPFASSRLRGLVFLLRSPALSAYKKASIPSKGRRPVVPPLLPVTRPLNCPYRRTAPDSSPGARGWVWAALPYRAFTDPGSLKKPGRLLAPSSPVLYCHQYTATLAVCQRFACPDYAFTGLASSCGSPRVTNPITIKATAWQTAQKAKMPRKPARSIIAPVMGGATMAAAWLNV